MKMIADIKVLNYHSKLISEDATQKSIFDFFFFFFLWFRSNFYYLNTYNREKNFTGFF